MEGPRPLGQWPSLSLSLNFRSMTSRWGTHLLVVGRNQPKGRTRSAGLGPAERTTNHTGGATLPTCLCGAHPLPPFGKVHGLNSPARPGQTTLPVVRLPPGPPLEARRPSLQHAQPVGQTSLSPRPTPSVSLVRGAARRQPHTRANGQPTLLRNPLAMEPLLLWGGGCPNPWKERLRGKARLLLMTAPLAAPVNPPRKGRTHSS